MGRYSLWLQVPLQLLATVAIIALAVFLASTSLRGAPTVAQIAGGLTIGILVQLAWRHFVLGPWQRHVDFQRMLRQVHRLAQQRYADQPYD